MRFAYSPHPSESYQETIYDNLVERSGRSRADWEREARSTGIPDSKRLAAWLQEEHGIGTNTAYIVAAHALGEMERPEPDQLVATMFAGKKAHLLPLYEHLLAELLPMGKDIRVCPATTIVPLYRKRVFAQIKPTTNSRIDLGLALGDVSPTNRLLLVSGAQPDDRIRHRMEVRSLSDIDEELLNWAQFAYDRSG